ncbi:hypothetical protein ACFP7A_13640 [Sporolactobacillus kofuensis]|uniref:DUF148 domain-containing protein n=1 Tax=Sporolactobacillus kofuensis TaxID=269672 RepID=A0ABW1WJU2_9BACL|nr:hypothetical protein [Sporolactobacillus kofuensis]MCO7177130.1 hypothetical protein [Sporolactobacillus kofuensis]
MKRSILVVLTILLLILIPHTTDAHCMDKVYHAHSNQKNEQAVHRQWLVHVIDQYAPATLAHQMKKDLATHRQLMNRWRQSGDFQRHREACMKKREQILKENAGQLKAIEQQVKLGKLSKQEAKQKIEQLFNTHGYSQHHRAIRDLRNALRRNDRSEIIQSLKKIDHHIQISNQHLAKKLKNEDMN